jgi:hypothetical protein
MAPGKLRLGTDAASNTAKLVSAYCGHPLGQPEAGSGLEATTSSGGLSGVGTVCTFIASASAKGADLLGATPEQQAQVSVAAGRRGRARRPAVPPGCMARDPTPPPPSPTRLAQVSEWLTWATTELGGLLDVKLAKVNDHLASRTYLVGSRLTLADLVAHGTVAPAVVGASSTQQQRPAPAPGGGKAA